MKRLIFGFKETILASLMVIAASLSFLFSWFLMFIDATSSFLGFTKTLNPRKILITGASRGIGEALAYEYSKPGNVVILIARNQNKLNDVKQKCQRNGAMVETQSIDVTNKAEVRRFIEEKFRQYNGLDLVIANAGITRSSFHHDNNLHNQQTEDLIEAMDEASLPIFDTNVQGVLSTVIPAYRQMVDRRHGQIAIVGSTAGFMGLPNYPLYNASKAALSSFARDLRSMAKNFGIKVSLVTPGFIETDMTHRTKQHGSTFPLSLMGDTQTLAISIRQGLEADWPIIGTYPFHQVFFNYVFAHSFTPRVKEVVSDILGLLRFGGHEIS